MSNKFESNNTKFLKEFLRRNGEIGVFKYVGVQDRALKLYPEHHPLSLWRKVPQDICNIMKKKLKVLFFVRHFSQYFTFYLPFDIFPWF